MHSFRVLGGLEDRRSKSAASLRASSCALQRAPTDKVIPGKRRFRQLRVSDLRIIYRKASGIALRSTPSKTTAPTLDGMLSETDRTGNHNGGNGMGRSEENPESNLGEWHGRA